MELKPTIVDKIKQYGVGHRKISDNLFKNDKLPKRLGIYDLDEENLCHEVIKTSCNIPGCKFNAESLLEFENHYNASHRYACGQCKKIMPSPHLLDLHIQEAHDSFFAVIAEKKPSYCCYIEECKEKFINHIERLDHCVKEHKLPKDFRFEQKPKSRKKGKASKKHELITTMELDEMPQDKKFEFTNSKQKAFAKYTGRRFAQNKNGTSSNNVSIDDVMMDLKNSLPE